MRWVQEMNNIRACAEKIVLWEVIYKWRYWTNIICLINELWYGNISPSTYCRITTKETKELMGYIATHHENLEATLDEKQKDILQIFDDCWSELSEINEREIITYAFRLGARIMLEVLKGETTWSIYNATAVELKIPPPFSNFRLFFTNSLIFLPLSLPTT